MDHPDAMHTSEQRSSSAAAPAQPNASCFTFFTNARPSNPGSQPSQHQQQASQPPARISKLVATTPGGETISIEIPAGLQQSWVQAMDMSPLDSVHCDSPGFNNFMMTLSPIMQLSSPQPTMSPREQTQPM